MNQMIPPLLVDGNRGYQHTVFFLDPEILEEPWRNIPLFLTKNRFWCESQEVEEVERSKARRIYMIVGQTAHERSD